MINLLPPEIKESRAYGRKNFSLLKYCAALIATALITAGIMIVSLKFIGAEEPDLRKELELYQSEITTLESQIKEVESIATQLETADKLNKQSISFSELIPKIGAVLPDGVILNALSLTGGPTDPLQLDVDMVNASLAPVLVKNLVDSDLFEAADISSLSPLSTTADSENTYTFAASVTASFTGTAEAARKAAAAEAAKKAAQEAAAQQNSSSQGGNE